jgi:DNA (cytosine-5)-methyltransferase 1
MNVGSLFSGYGGLDLAVEAVFGAETAWFSEIEDAPSKILAHHRPTVPNLGDITKIDWDQVEPVDILDGGFPCQDVSLAGKRAGLRPDSRSGLWSHFALGISKLRPQYVVIENVRGLLSAEAHSDVEPCPWCLGDGPGEPALRALGAVLADLAELGYDARWFSLRAADVGAPHGRYRVFIVAQHTAEPRLQGQTSGRLQPSMPGSGCGGLAADANDTGRQQHGRPVAVRPELAATERGGDPAADADCDPVREQPVDQPRLSGETITGLAGDLAADSAFERRRTARGYDGVRPAGLVTSDIGWGQYAPAIHRWERILGRVAPAPTEPNSKGSQRLNPAFVEWMMGLPAGWVTDVPGISRNEQLRMLGNGVVPQQAAAALQMLLAATLAPTDAAGAA